MSHEVITRMSLESFFTAVSGYKIAIMYPWTNYRNLFLSYFLSEAIHGFLYYRIPHNQDNARTWLSGLVDEFDAVLGGFGDNLKPLLPDGDAEALGQALAADLGVYQAKANRVVLYLDELDRLPMDRHFNGLIAALVNALPEQVQLTVSSRMLTYETWVDKVTDGTAVVLGPEYRKNDVMFTVEKTPHPQLEVYALGRGCALINGKEILNWGGTLPRNLFFYFLDHPLATRDEIFATFWPTLSAKEATNVFHVTKRKMTEQIASLVGDDGNYELTQYETGLYIPSDKLIRHYDVADFQEAIDQAMIAVDEREEAVLLRRAIDLYKAPFLQTVTMTWAAKRREQLADLYAQALIGMGHLYQRRDEYRPALGFYLRGLREVPGREDVHRQVMSLYLKMGMRDDALRQYDIISQYLKETLGIEPARETQSIYDSILTQVTQV